MIYMLGRTREVFRFAGLGQAEERMSGDCRGMAEHIIDTCLSIFDALLSTQGVIMLFGRGGTEGYRALSFAV